MIDFDKPVRFIESHDPFTVISTEGRDPFNIVGYVGGNRIPTAVNAGMLENIPQKRSGWVNVFADYPPEVTDCPRRVGHEYVFNTKHEAQNAGRGYGDYVTTAYIEWEEQTQGSGMGKDTR